MSLTPLSWILIVASLAMLALLILPTRWRDAAWGLALLSRLRSSGRALVQGLPESARTPIVAAAAFILVAGIGAVASYRGEAPQVIRSEHTASSSLPHSGLDGEEVARLKDYTRSMGTENPPPMAAAGELLPDVDTMIERLAARLESAPEDIDGWRMLAWSYFHTERYEQAANAYAKAVALDPGSAELKLAYEEAKAKASGSASPEATKSN